jgi:acyl carrier protein
MLDCDLATSESRHPTGTATYLRPMSRNVNDLEDLVRRAISKICAVDVARVQPDASLDDLGVDSLAAAEILVEVEIALDRQLPVDVLRRLDHVETVRDIATELEASFGAERSKTLP